MAIPLPALQGRGLDFSQIGKGIDATVAQQTNALNASLRTEQIEAFRQKRADKKRFKELAGRATGGESGARATFLEEFPVEGVKALNAFAELKGEEKKQARAEIKFRGVALRGVTTQEGYDAVLASLEQSGEDVSDLQKQFTPQAVSFYTNFADEVDKVRFGQPVQVQGPDGPQLVQFSNTGLSRDTGRVPVPKAEKETAPTQLSKLIAERNALPPGSPNISTFDAAIQKTALGSGFDIEFGEDGRVTRISQGSGSRKAPSGNRQDEIQAQIDANTVALSTLDKVEAAIKEDPTRAGVAGGIRSFTQRFAGAFVDVVKLVGVDISGIGLAKELAKKFDPNLPEIDIAENSLAYALARTRKPTGRLNRQDFDNAKKDINLKGATSSQEALARVDVIREQFNKAQKNLRERRGGDRRKKGRRQGTKTRLRFDAQGNQIQ